MPLAIRSVNRRVGSTAGFDADAAAYIRAVQNADGAALEPAVAHAINAFVLGCKADGIWDDLQACCILMGARTLTGALTALKGSGPTNVNFVSGDYNRETGLTGNRSTKYLNTNRANNADGQNDKHIAVYASTLATTLSTQATYIGAGGAGNVGATVISRQASNGTHQSRLNAGAITTFPAVTLAGFIGLSRSANNNYTRRADSADSTATTTSETPSSDNLFVFARNDGSGNPGNYGNPTISFYSIGTALTLSTLETRVSDLYTAIGNAIP